MIFVPKKNIYFPKYQRGNFSMFPAGTMSLLGAGSVLMTGAVSSHTDLGNAVSAGFAFQPDGSIDEIGPQIIDRTQVDPGEWWTKEPQAGIGSSYDVRWIGPANSWSAEAAAINVWIQISVERVWRILVTAHDAPSLDSIAGTFEIRDTGSGGALDSGLYSADVEN